MHFATGHIKFLWLATINYFIMKTYEQKKVDLKEAISFYEQGFISNHSFVRLVAEIDWNPLERAAVEAALEKTITIDYQALKMLLL